MSRRLRREVRIDVRYDDRTPFGSPITQRPELSIRSVFQPVHEHVDRRGYGDLVRLGPQLLDAVVRGETFTRIAEPVAGGSWTVRPEILYPEVADAPPAHLTLALPGTATALGGEIPFEAWPEVHELLAALSGQGLDLQAAAGPVGSALLPALEREGLLEDAEDAGAGEPDGEITFVGHNTVVVRSATSSVVVDPWVMSGGNTYPAGYQPLQRRDLGRLDGAVITHSHPDHFNPSTLLQLPPNIRMIVPRVERENILAADMVARLRELGFTNVSAMEWWERTRIGDIDVWALPFHGEQPTDGDVLHPEVRNAGNTYFLRTPDFSAAFLADSGRDYGGDVRQVAAHAAREIGSPDYLFAGYRGWLTYAVQFLFTSVGRYILFVPREQWGVRQRIMTSAEEVIDVAEIWAARHVVPYADGGAPWYWEIGLGPTMDGTPREASGFDPLPERVIEAARNRTEMPGGTLASAVEVVLMRPGDSIAGARESPHIVRTPGFTWPYAEQMAPAGAPAVVG